MPVVFAVVACAKHPDIDAERAAIAAADSAWLAMSSTDDVDSIVSFWTEDSRVIAPGQPPIIGRAAIRQMVDESLKIPGFSINWHTTDVIVAPMETWATRSRRTSSHSPGRTARSIGFEATGSSSGGRRPTVAGEQT
jgi:hypothetical protein